MNTAKKVLAVAKIASNPVGFLYEQIVDNVVGSIDDTDNVNKLELAELQLAAQKQELHMRMAEAQARVAQELAIAKRIEMAIDVEIEEIYDLKGEGSLGLKAEEKSLTVGASASGHKVSKRIYRFHGSNIQTPEEIKSANT